jgi:hypothetical protein
MPNLRIIYSNAVARNLSLVASSTAGSLAASNLLTDIKSQVWRSTSTTASLTLTWTNAETVGGVALPYTNLTPTATIRVRGYTNVGDASPAVDTGVVSACSYTPWTLGLLPSGVNGFAYGVGAYACAWLAQTAVKKIVIDIVDSANTAGYIEAGRLVVGNYWSPAVNANLGAALTMLDTSKHLRNDAGDLMTDIGTRARKISVSLDNMVESDRIQFMNILRGNGMPNPIFFSLYPSSSSPDQEQSHQIYCKLSAIGAIVSSKYALYTAPLELEEV